MNRQDAAAECLAALSTLIEMTGRTTAVLLSTHPHMPGVFVETFGETKAAGELGARVRDILNPNQKNAEVATQPMTFSTARSANPSLN